MRFKSVLLTVLQIKVVLFCFLTFISMLINTSELMRKSQSPFLLTLKTVIVYENQTPNAI